MYCIVCIVLYSAQTPSSLLSFCFGFIAGSCPSFVMQCHVRQLAAYSAGRRRSDLHPAASVHPSSSAGNMAAFDMSNPDSVVSPGGVGFDINCGVRLLRTNLSYKDVQPIQVRRQGDTGNQLLQLQTALLRSAAKLLESGVTCRLLLKTVLRCFYAGGVLRFLQLFK